MEQDPYTQTRDFRPGHLYIVLSYPEDVTFYYEQGLEHVPAFLHKGHPQSDDELEYGWCFIIPYMVGNRLFFRRYRLVHITNHPVIVGPNGRVPEDCIPNGHLVKTDHIKVQTIEKRGEIKKIIQGVIILLKTNPIDMVSFEEFLANHDYIRHPRFYTSPLPPGGYHREHLWARRVLLDCPDINVDEDNIIWIEYALRVCARKNVTDNPRVRNWTKRSNPWRIYEFRELSWDEHQGELGIKQEEDDERVIKRER